MNHPIHYSKPLITEKKVDDAYFSGFSSSGLAHSERYVADMVARFDLEFARCRMMVAVREGYDYAGTVRQGARIRVATKYVNAARDHFASKGVHIDLIKLYGSMELAPLVGLSDVIVDLVSTGGTLKANGLVAVEYISDISSRLVVNQAVLKLKRGLIQPVIDGFSTAVGTGSAA